MDLSLLSPQIQALLIDVASRRAVRAPSDIVAFMSYLNAQPKVETHVHLEAAVGSDFYLSRAESYVWQGCRPWERAPYGDFQEFIRAWVDLSQSICKLTDLEDLAEAFVINRMNDNIRYSEVYFSPADFSLLRKRFKVTPHVFDFYDTVSAYVTGLKKGLSRVPEVEVRLVMDSFWPSTTSEQAIIFDCLMRMTSEASFYDERGMPYVVGVGLGGPEKPLDIEQTARFVSDVRGLGFKIDIHSGEGGDPTLHRSHVDALRPDRVAHGFSAVSDGWYFKDNLVMCPLSNILLKTHQGHPELHPVFDLLKTGASFAVGTDDPLLLGHTLSQEFAFLYAIDSSFSEQTFHKIQQDTKKRVLCPDVFRRVFS